VRGGRRQGGRRPGKPVVVTSETTPNRSVVAHPNGMLSMTSNPLPVRVKEHGAWTAINPSLRRTGAGTWAPVASPEPVVFSGGGGDPLVTITDPASGQHLSLSWPNPLPRPVISGPVALYRSVLPGIDLRLKANNTGYQETLVVRDAAAAADPGLWTLSFGVRVSSGLSLRGGPGGSLDAISGATGKAVFIAGQPQMWDSSKTQHFDLPATADYAGSGRVSLVPVSYQTGTTTGKITMSPPAAALTGPAVRYPAYIDPNFGSGVAPSYYSEVMRTDSGDTHTWNSTTNSTVVSRRPPG
jgi:hypothetical protein